ncbi:hypothetical protein RRG08_010383 [Elysia crispata]|uniref:Uncharacterized protein n=1 Tax=Elysia crispata TaxID=231223 RepID=A0AAE1BAK0_9GAST|nr:hypothetical protein RRG08_010383 [Elysia crispata]
MVVAPVAGSQGRQLKGLHAPRPRTYLVDCLPLTFPGGVRFGENPHGWQQKESLGSLGLVERLSLDLRRTVLKLSFPDGCCVTWPPAVLKGRAAKASNSINYLTPLAVSGEGWQTPVYLGLETSGGTERESPEIVEVWPPVATVVKARRASDSSSTLVK